MAAVTMYPRLIMMGAAPETRDSIAALVEAYRAAGLFKRWPIDYVPTHCGGGALASAPMALRAARDLVAAIARHDRVALHVHSAAGPGFWRDAALMATAHAARCPVILHLHGGGFDRFHDACGTARRIAIRTLLERASVVAVASEWLRSWIRSVSRGANVVCVPYPVVMPARGDPRPNLVLFLGRLAAEKGIYDLLQAISALRDAVPDVRLVCAGDGDRIGVAREAERLGIADAVKFTGWVGPSGKRALLENAAVFALPSYSEGMPMSLLEAMAAGVPAVATPVGGIPEVVVDGVSGFLAAPGDAATLTRLLRRLLLDHKLRAGIGAAGRETVRLRFAPERALPRLEAIYAEVGLRSILVPWPASQAG
jgi:glycosyltransferase involved in cell wall biosynthesis